MFNAWTCICINANLHVCTSTHQSLTQEIVELPPQLVRAQKFVKGLGVAVVNFRNLSKKIKYKSWGPVKAMAIINEAAPSSVQNI